MKKTIKPKRRPHARKRRKAKLKQTEYKTIIHSRKWRTIRGKVLQVTPYCALCLMLGTRTPAAEVHHIRPIQWGSSPEEKLLLAYDYTNLVPLCHEHHIGEHRRLRILRKESLEAEQRTKESTR